MKLATWIKPTLIAGSVLMLAACSGTYGSSKEHGGSSSPNGSLSATPTGAGADSQFMGTSKTNRTCPKGAYDCVYFDYDSSKVDSKYYADLQHEAEYLDKNKDEKVIVQGNTDARGSREYNIGLGNRRAKAVASLLEGYGVSSDQIQTLSYGAEKPWVAGSTEHAFELNRRVDLINKVKGE